MTVVWWMLTEMKRQRMMADAYRRIARRWQMAFWLIAPGGLTAGVLLVVCHAA